MISFFLSAKKRIRKLKKRKKLRLLANTKSNELTDQANRPTLVNSSTEEGQQHKQITTVQIDKCDQKGIVNASKQQNRQHNRKKARKYANPEEFSHLVKDGSAYIGFERSVINPKTDDSLKVAELIPEETRQPMEPAQIIDGIENRQEGIIQITNEKSHPNEWCDLSIRRSKTPPGFVRPKAYYASQQRQGCTQITKEKENGLKSPDGVEHKKPTEELVDVDGPNHLLSTSFKPSIEQEFASLHIQIDHLDRENDEILDTVSDSCRSIPKVGSSLFVVTYLFQMTIATTVTEDPSRQDACGKSTLDGVMPVKDSGPKSTREERQNDVPNMKLTNPKPKDCRLREFTVYITRVSCFCYDKLFHPILQKKVTIDWSEMERKITSSPILGVLQWTNCELFRWKVCYLNHACFQSR